MEKIIFLNALLTIFVAISIPASAQDAASLRDTIERHYVAINSGENDTVWEHHRPEMSLFAGNGMMLIRDEDLLTGIDMGATLPFADVTSVFVNDYSAQIYGNVGIATFYLVGSNTTDDNTTRGTWRVTAVWIYEGGEWTEAHHHESPLVGLQGGL